MLIILHCLIILSALSIGSFINVIIYRLPKMLKDDQTINLAWPRSHCPNCKTRISLQHLIPIFSFLYLRRCCATCKQAISWRYPLIECITLLCVYLALWHYGFNLYCLTTIIFILWNIPLFIIDLEHQLLPDILTLSLLWIGLLLNTQAIYVPINAAIFGAAIAYSSLWLFIQIYYLITKKWGMGHGDFKLFAAYGAWFGWQKLPLLLFIACLLGAIIGGLWLYYNKQSKETPIAFGPFLILAALLLSCST